MKPKRARVASRTNVLIAVGVVGGRSASRWAAIATIAITVAVAASLLLRDKVRVEARHHRLHVRRPSSRGVEKAPLLKKCKMRLAPKSPHAMPTPKPDRPTSTLHRPAPRTLRPEGWRDDPVSSGPLLSRAFRLSRRANKSLKSARAHEHMWISQTQYC